MHRIMLPNFHTHTHINHHHEFRSRCSHQRSEEPSGAHLVRLTRSLRLPRSLESHQSLSHDPLVVCERPLRHCCLPSEVSSHCSSAFHAALHATRLGRLALLHGVLRAWHVCAEPLFHHGSSSSLLHLASRNCPLDSKFVFSSAAKSESEAAVLSGGSTSQGSESCTNEEACGREPLEGTNLNA